MKKINFRKIIAICLAGTTIFVLFKTFKSVSTDDEKEEYSKPLEASLPITQIEQTTIEYHQGTEVIIQSKHLKIYTFDENGKIISENGEKVLVDGDQYNLEYYISENEEQIYKIIENKDRIIDQYNIYRTINWIKNLYIEYLSCKDLQKIELDRRKEFLYRFLYDFVVGSGEDKITMGKYNYSQLEPSIQTDIRELFEKILYMRENGVQEPTSNMENFIDTQGKVIRYSLFGIGRNH